MPTASDLYGGILANGVDWSRLNGGAPSNVAPNTGFGSNGLYRYGSGGPPSGDVQLPRNVRPNVTIPDPAISEWMANPTANHVQEQTPNWASFYDATLGDLRNSFTDPQQTPMGPAPASPGALPQATGSSLPPLPRPRPTVTAPTALPKMSPLAPPSTAPGAPVPARMSPGLSDLRALQGVPGGGLGGLFNLLKTVFNNAPVAAAQQAADPQRAADMARAVAGITGRTGEGNTSGDTQFGVTKSFDGNGHFAGYLGKDGQTYRTLAEAQAH